MNDTTYLHQSTMCEINKLINYVWHCDIIKLINYVILITALSVTVLILQTLFFGLNVTLMLVFNFTVLSYRAIHMFLV
jgi:hypothetical protein